MKLVDKIEWYLNYMSLSFDILIIERFLLTSFSAASKVTDNIVWVITVSQYKRRMFFCFNQRNQRMTVFCSCFVILNEFSSGIAQLLKKKKI